MKKLFCYGLFIFCLTIPFSQLIFAQSSDSTLLGSVDGVVRDSAHNYVLVSASLAIYNTNDSSLITYQLSNNLGEFHFKRLPINVPLKIVVNYLGYQNSIINFIIPEKERKIQLYPLNMRIVSNKLKEVVVSFIPPVRMNGDTLEFNSDAFKLDPNAQTEDLLRRLPGITVWGDGTITLNGKKVSSVLVNGRPFFGGDVRIATQNLPKNVVDKIQIYQRNKNTDAPLDSITEINIKLKKGKEAGYFGKINGSLGTDKRYETDESFNLYSSRTQIGIVASNNNVNKMADDVETLMRKNTFKGIGASIEYQPDFLTQGLNKFNSGGLIFQHDFIPEPDYYQNNRLTANYFIKGNQQYLSQNIQTVTLLTGNNSITQHNKGERRSFSTSQNLNIEYEKHKNDNTFSIASSINNDVLDRVENQNLFVNSEQNLQSTNKLFNEWNTNVRRLSFGATLKHKANDFSPNYEINYLFKSGDNGSEQSNITEFVSIVDSGQNKSYDRQYNINNNDMEHQLFLKFPNFSKWILGKDNKTAGIVVGLEDNFDLITSNGNNLVNDEDTLTKIRVLNPSLTNKNTDRQFSMLPAISIGKDIQWGLKNRYQKELDLLLNLRTQFFVHYNESDHSFQNFNHRYKKFLPEVILSFKNKQIGEYSDNYKLSFSKSSDYPTVQQLVPLVDSSNLYYILEGNSQLMAEDKSELNFSLEHASDKSENILYYIIKVKAGSIGNYFGDSSFINISGRSVHYTVNTNENRYFNFGGNLNKAFKFNKNQIQLSVSTSITFSKSPNYVNGSKNYSANSYTYNNINLYYTYEDRLTANLEQSFNYYRSSQKGLYGNKFISNQQATTLSVSTNLRVRFLISSNITYNKTSSIGSGEKDFTIWNASASYRIFKGNNGQISFSALDLLHQNTGVINYGLNNSMIYGTTNILQQYFILTLSYFPRKFRGKKGPNR